MSSYRRNVMVGAVVVTGMLVLGWMIIQFGGAIITPFSPKQIPIRFEALRGDGLSEGSPVQYLGVSVGRVTRVIRDSDQKRVFIEALVDVVPPLPGNVSGFIVTQGLVSGGSKLELRPPLNEPPQGEIQPNQSFVAKYIGLDLLPAEFSDLSAELRMTVKQFRESNVVGNLNDKLTRAGTLIDSANKLIADDKLQGDVKQSVANIRTATESINKVLADFQGVSGKLDKLATDASDTVNQAKSTLKKADGKIDDVTASLNERLLEISKLLVQFNAIATKIDNGQGTAGKLVADPKLYEGLVLTTDQLNATIKDLQRLIQQWEQEGVTLKLK